MGSPAGSDEIATPAPAPCDDADRRTDPGWVEWFGLTAAHVGCGCGRRVRRRGVVPRAHAAAAERGEPAGCERENPTEPAGDVDRRDPGSCSVDDAATSGPVIVHVAGAVLLPGVYELGPGAASPDAVEGAGGATADAELGRINLAAALVDGGQIYVPAVGEDVPLPPAGSASAPPGSTPSVRSM